MPQAVGLPTKSSSVCPSQSSSTALQLESLAAGVPGEQSSGRDPETHERVPSRRQAPTPHVVAEEPSPSSISPSQSLSTPSQSSVAVTLTAEFPSSQSVSSVTRPSGASHIVTATSPESPKPSPSASAT